jgi:hypothetical protein
VNIDFKISSRQSAIKKIKERADELRAYYDSVLAKIPCERQSEASQKMQGISALITKAEQSISKLQEEIRILVCIKNNQSRKKIKSCSAENKKTENQRGKGGRDGNAGDRGVNARDRTKGRLGELQRCMGENGKRG